MSKELKIKGRAIRVDDTGRVSLNDIHTAAGFSKNQTPADWNALDSAKKLITATIRKLTGKSGYFEKADIQAVHYTKRGPGGGVWAHPIVALGYAEYLSPALAVEVREVFLRYKAADPTLADDVLSRGTPEANEWAATRALGRVKRNEYTATLQAHGVEGFGFANCTNAVYETLFDAKTKALKKARGLPANSNLRDHMGSDELVSIMFAEMLSKQRIDEEDPFGNRECEMATRRSSARVRATIEDDRKDRQRRLAG